MEVYNFFCLFVFHDFIMHRRNKRQKGSWLAVIMSVQHVSIAWQSRPCNTTPASPSLHPLLRLSHFILMIQNAEPDFDSTKRTICNFSTKYQENFKAVCSRTLCIGDGMTGKVGGAHDDGRAQQMCRGRRHFIVCLDAKEETGKQREFRKCVRPCGRHKRDGLENLVTYCCGGGGRGRRVGRSLCAKMKSEKHWSVMTVHGHSLCFVVTITE